MDRILEDAALPGTGFSNYVSDSDVIQTFDSDNSKKHNDTTMKNIRSLDDLGPIEILEDDKEGSQSRAGFLSIDDIEKMMSGKKAPKRKMKNNKKISKKKRL